jgi:two-component system, OmpR family, sensor histidine kinase PhoQ
VRRSLGTRLLIVASLVMAVFFGITGIVIERAYYETADAALKQRLQSFAAMLIAASEPGFDGGVRITHPVPETRLFLPRSGLYARMYRNDGLHAWDSPSLDGKDIAFPVGLERGARRYDTLTLNGATAVRSFSIGVAWEGDMPVPEVYTVSVAEDVTAFNAEVAGFRRTLWGWLLVVALMLLTVQWAVLRWGLAPLRRAAGDIAAIEAGRKARLDGVYPAELQGLTENLNALVQNERERRDRYRLALGDLAHSLKTPLAILRGAAEGRDDGGFRATVEDQVERMSGIVDYQLRRAATAGRSALRETVQVEPVVRRVVDALGKAWRDKGVRCAIDIESGVRFNGDEEDLVEILGNLLDNAFKWCRTEISAALRRPGAPGERRGGGLVIVIDDDGPGIPDDVKAAVFGRGVRGDESREGHGIGLAIVRDIVDAYHGRIEISRSDRGGARVIVTL